MIWPDLPEKGDSDYRSRIYGCVFVRDGWGGKGVPGPLLRGKRHEGPQMKEGERRKPPDPERGRGVVAWYTLGVGPLASYLRQC